MALTLQEIKYLEFPRAWLRGYKRQQVDRILEEVSESLEVAYRERDELAERLSTLDAEASKQRELEELLRSALVSAERAVQEMKEQARRESDLIVQEAHAEARQVTRESVAEKQRIEQETRKIRTMLRSALDALEAGPEHVESRAEEPAPQPVEVEEITGDAIRKIAG